MGNGGKERQLVETLRNLDLNLFRIGLITFNSNQYYSKLAKRISEYFSVLTKDKSVLEPFVTVFEAFERFKPDIVHSYDLLSSMYTYFPSKMYNTKIINASIQDSGLDKGWQFKVKKRLLSVSNINISNSMKGFSYYNTYGEVLYNFIDSQRFSDEKNNVGFNVAMVANFSEYKDYLSYFRVVKELIKFNLIDKAYAVGSGKYLSKYQMEIDADENLKDKVIFTGNTENVERFLSNVSIGFLFSTEEYGEGISNSVLEYMASGVIPVVSDIGASSEIIDNGVDGFLVNKYDTVAIVEIVSKLRKDERIRDQIIENAKKKISDRFDLKRNIKQLVDIYSRICKN
ncbi:MAG: glycosyltransferase [Ignavibacteria bacterium]